MFVEVPKEGDVGEHVDDQCPLRSNVIATSVVDSLSNVQKDGRKLCLREEKEEVW